MNMQTADTLEELCKRKFALEAGTAATPGFAKRLRDLRMWQAGRLAETYEDLRRQPRYAAAVEFFLNDLYGPQDLSPRDKDLLRACRFFARALPGAALEILKLAVALDVLSAELDHAMAQQLGRGGLTSAAYAAAYRRVGRADERQRQIELLIGIGEALDRIVLRRWVDLTLRGARLPARMAGFGALQNFLERGFAAFRDMHGAQLLLQAIRERETRLMRVLFKGAEGRLAG
jgi:hypothetical protein